MEVASLCSSILHFDVVNMTLSLRIRYGDMRRAALYKTKCMVLRCFRVLCWLPCAAFRSIRFGTIIDYSVTFIWGD